MCHCPMTSTDRLDELELRLRMAMAHALHRATAEDPAWRSFEPSLRHSDEDAAAAQKGMSSFLSAARREEAGGDSAA
jgi:hypothetical protein